MGKFSLKMKATKLRQILVPIDFSPESRKALRFATLLAARFGATLHLVHVVIPPSFPLWQGMHPSAFSEKQITASALKRLKRLAAEFALSSRPNPCTVRAGVAADKINEVAREIGADIIAISTRGYTGLKRAFLGSTTGRVLRSAPCPVLVLRDAEHLTSRQKARRRRAPLQFRKMLVPLDFSGCSRFGLDYAFGFAREYGASLVLFHSIPIVSHALGHEDTAREVPNLLGQQQDFAENEMKALRDELPESNLEVTTKVSVGSLVEQIEDYVRAHDVDLIIASTHGHSGFQHIFIGSIAEQIVRHAPCPVLFVPKLPVVKEAKDEQVSRADALVLPRRSYCR